jgi:hypothetical protein
MEPTETSKKSLKQTVEDWILTEGYPLEMRVARAFRKAKPTRVSQGDLYLETRTSTVREIDIRAYWREGAVDGNEAGNQLLVLEFDVECKSGGSAWVAFHDLNEPTSKPRPYSIEPNLEMLASTSSGNFRRIFNEEIESRQPRLLTHGAKAAYALSQHRKNRNEKDWAYAAVRQAISGARGLEKWIKERVISGFREYCLCFIPVVVTDIPLFRCTLSADNRIEVEETPRELLVSADDEGTFVTVHIVHTDALPQFVEECAEAAEAFLAATKDTLARIRADEA